MKAVLYKLTNHRWKLQGSIRSSNNQIQLIQFCRSARIVIMHAHFDLTTKANFFPCFQTFRLQTVVVFLITGEIIIVIASSPLVVVVPNSAAQHGRNQLQSLSRKLPKSPRPPERTRALEKPGLFQTTMAFFTLEPLRKSAF